MEAYGWFGTAYFMYDIWSMYKVHTQKIADKLHLLRLTKPDHNKSLRNGHGGGAGGAGGGNNNGSTPSTPHEICDYDGACVQIPKDGRWDFLKYVLTHPVMMIHHVFIGTFGLLVVTVSYTRFPPRCSMLIFPLSLSLVHTWRWTLHLQLHVHDGVLHSLCLAA